MSPVPARSRLLGLAAAGFGVLLAASPAGPDTGPLRPAGPPLFSADVSISVDGEGRPSLELSLSVPYAELQWLSLPRGFGAGVGLSVSFLPRSGGRQLFGDSWERRLVVPTFGPTLSSALGLVEHRTFRVPPGRYRVRVAVQDLESRSSSSATGTIQVQDYSRLPVGFAGLELGLVDSAGGFRAVPSRVFGQESARLAASASLFDRREGVWPRRYSFRYRVSDDQGAELQSGTVEGTLARPGEPVFLRLGIADLFLGSYVLQVELDEGRSRWRVDRAFEVEESGPPRGKEFERMLGVLAYIAEPGEVQRLRALPDSARAGGWRAFWSRRDPTPESAQNEAEIEFFRRVRYATHHFEGFGPGWQSDMGRVYIKLGPPDQIEGVSAGAAGVAQEIWTYTRPSRRFVFEDREGFGRWVLVSPAFE